MPTGRPRTYVHTDLTDAAIRKAYQSPDYGLRRGPIKALQRTLGWPNYIIRQRAVALGVFTPKRKEPPWTEAEIELLDKYGHLHNRRVRMIFARHGYQRTEAAIGIALKRKLDGKRIARDDAGIYCCRDAAEILGVSDRTVRRFIDQHWLEAKPSEIAAGANVEWSITRQALAKFIKKHTAHVELRRANKFLLIDVLTWDGQ